MRNFLIGEEFSWVVCGEETVLFNVELGKSYQLAAMTAEVFRAYSQGLKSPGEIASKLAGSVEEGKEILSQVKAELSYLSSEKLIG